MRYTSQRHLGSRELHALRRQRMLLAGLVVLVLFAVAFYLGEQAAYRGMGLSPELHRAQKAEIPALQARVAELETELEVQRVQSAVDKQALEMVRQQMAEQKEQAAALEEGLRFYRGLMAPGELGQGLSLRPLEVVSLDEPDQFAFRIVAQQEALKHPLVKGQLSAKVVGVLVGQEVSYPLAELSEELDSNAIKLSFRYFQSIEGTLSLPEGFEPRRVDIQVTAATPRKMEVGAQFPWQVKERFTHVGK